MTTMATAQGRTWLNGKRLRYSWIAAAAMWGAWIVSILLGQGAFDQAGQVIGTDYVQFYAAGETVRVGESARLYDVDYQIELERSIVGSELRSYHAFITLPFLAPLFAPLSALPYVPSFALWCLLGGAALVAGFRLLRAERPLQSSLWALTFFPVFASFSFGQNSILSFLLLSAAFALWMRGRTVWAGIVLALLLYKPQLILGVALMWLVRREWRPLGGLAAGGGLLGAAMLLWMPEATVAYVEFARSTLPGLTGWEHFPLWHLHTWRGFWTLLLGAGAANVPTAACTALIVAGFWAVSRRFTGRRETHFALAILVTLLITPHAMIYDWALLLIPACLLWRTSPELRTEWTALYAVIWLVAFVGGPLSYAQLQFLGHALQISVPLLTAVAIAITYRLGLSSHKTGAESKEPV